MKKIYLIRHGWTRADKHRLYCGATDLPLTKSGAAELRKAAEEFSYPSAENCRIYTSGMLCAEQTLKLIWGKQPHETLPALREMNFGDFEMHSYEELKDDAAFSAWLSGDNEVNVCPNGESGVELKKRAIAAFTALAGAAGNAIVVTHGGVIARCTERTLPSPTAENLPKNAFLCLLDGIEDPYNFGYALRSLYAAGCDAILAGTRNWFSAAGVVAKASAGASEALPAFCGDPMEAVLLAKSLGYTVVAASIRDAVSYTEANLKKPILLIVGGEKRGVCSAIAKLVDQNVRIDYGRSFRGSLSTSAATTVLAFEILRQNGEI